MAINKNIITEIVNSMAYSNIGSIEFMKDEKTKNVIIIECVDNEAYLNRVYFVDRYENNIIIAINRDEYHESFNDSDDDTRFFDVDINKDYMTSSIIISNIDRWFNTYLNNYSHIDDNSYLSYNQDFTNVVSLLWHNSKNISDDDYEYVGLEFRLVSKYNQPDVNVTMKFFNNNDMDFYI